MRTSLIATVIGVLVAGCGTPTTGTAPQPSAAVAVVAARVTRVIDGDTAEMRLSDGTTEKVRFIGIDTPESTNRHEPYGDEAASYTKRVLGGREVYLETGVERRDRYRRLLAYVWLEVPVTADPAEVRRGMFNAHLLGDGYAQLLTVPPNVAYVDVFRALQAEARSEDRGLWGLDATGPRS